MDNVIWVDENDTELGIISRERAHREGLLHRIVVTYLTRPNGDILGQERMSGRLDHSSAGHVDPGESYLAAAKRELNEELGITPENFNELRQRCNTIRVTSATPEGLKLHFNFSCTARVSVSNEGRIVKVMRYFSRSRLG